MADINKEMKNEVVKNDIIKHVRVDKNNVLVQGKGKNTQAICVVDEHRADLVKSVQKEKRNNTILAWLNGVAVGVTLVAAVVAAKEGADLEANSALQNLKAFESTAFLLISFVNGYCLGLDIERELKYKNILKKHYANILENCGTDSIEEMGK